MLLPVYLTAAMAALFYALIPVVGAFIVRSQWRRFRRSVRDAARLPPLEQVTARKELPAVVLARGEIDAMGRDDELWITGRDTSFVINLSDACIYVLSGRRGDDKIERQRWKDLKAIGPGARAFISGKAQLTDGRISIGGDLLVILHDGDDENVVRRAVWAGRHDNEYWNSLTQVSMALGVASMSVIARLTLPGRLPALVTALMLTAAFSPVLSLLPPGVAGFFLYRRYWRRARYCRARRDLAELEEASSAGVELWRKRASYATAASIGAFAAAMTLNAWLLVAVLRRLL